MNSSRLSQAYERATAAARRAAAVAARAAQKLLSSRRWRGAIVLLVCAFAGTSIYAAYRLTGGAGELDAIIDADALGYALIFAFLVFMFWLARRDIRASAEKSDGSDQSLRTERDSLELRVTERTQALVAAEQARIRELERIAQFGALSQGLFHDLMSPLSSLSLYMEDMAERQPDPEESRTIVARAVEVSRRMRSFMDNVKQCLGSSDVRATDAADLCAEAGIARDLLMYKARTAGVQLRMGCAGRIQVNAHPLRVQQLFLNLISNGIDACAAVSHADAQKIVDVSVIREKDAVEIQVTDSGCGIPAERLDALFDHSFSTKPGGTGIGLGIIRSIVRTELRGSIRVESKIGRGTVFTIRIPIE